MLDSLFSVSTVAVAQQDLNTGSFAAGSADLVRGTAPQPDQHLR